MERKKNQMRKHRIAAFIVMMIAAVPLICAAPSQSDFLPLSSQFYREFDTLMTMLGREVNMTRPYTYGEAAGFVRAIDRDSLSSAEIVLYDYLAEETAAAEDSKTVSFDARMTLQPEMYLHYNTGTFSDPIERTEDNKLIYSYANTDKYMLWNKDEPPLFEADLALSFKDTVTLFFRAPVTNTVHTGVPKGTSVWMTNIPILAAPVDTSLDSFQDFSMNFPKRAYMSIAGDWYSVQIGREQLNYGSGITGGFTIDGSLPYHNALSLSFFSDTFKYTFLLSFFPHPSQYMADPSAVINGNMHETDLMFDQNTNAFTGTKMFMSHRFDWTMGNGRHRMAVTEGIMYQSDDGILDLQILNPMMFFHNMYIAGNSNSILQVEWDMALTKGLRQHLAIAIDDFSIPFEGEDGSKPRPNAIGVQYGLTSAHELGDGIIESEAEITYMSPYLYLRDGKKASDNPYPLDFVVAIRNQRSGEGVYDLYSIGYPNGGDQMIAHLGVTYRVPFSYCAGLAAEYRLFGKNNLMTIYDSEENEDMVLSHMLTISAEGGYSFMPELELYGAIEGRMVFNYGNEKDRFEHDVLFTLGMKYLI